ncbi:MAG: MFS transporter [Bacilli bacterium]|nr:MFS transporter [Bacilli bacterium]MDD3304728.1 MFS transporter [Bacilli bacterium]MDD4053593.1 MFS transporter [Bacilli bacterium]MDD4411092.1 MFS transporter [Bacilli bacterium]
MNREKIFNIFVFLSTLARSLIDCFIPIILYNRGLEVKYIIIFLLLNYSLCFLLNAPLGHIGKKITFKWTMIVTSFSIGIAYYFLLIADLNIISLFLFALFHAVSTHVYWLSRHYYALEVLPKKELADEVGNIIIFSTLAIIPVSYAGGWFMNNLSMELVLIIIVFLYAISVIPLFYIKERKRYVNLGVIESSIKVLTSMPIRSFWFMILAQFRMVSRYLFPLFLFIYIKQDYEYIGIFNISVGVASMFFVYFFARRMDRDKKDYLIVSGILGAVVYLFKANVTDVGIMLLVGLAEGLIDKMYDVAFHRNLYALGHQYEGLGYTVAIEGLQNISRIIITFIFVLIGFDLKTIIYISAFMLIINGVIGFDDGKGGYKLHYSK